MIETDLGRSRVLSQLKSFIRRFDDAKIVILAMDSSQSQQWDEENNDRDFQNEIGSEVISKISDQPVTAAILCCDRTLPVLLLCKNENDEWDGIGVDKRLRSEVKMVLENKFRSAQPGVKDD